MLGSAFIGMFITVNIAVVVALLFSNAAPH
jgi:hypothetical protein